MRKLGGLIVFLPFTYSAIFLASISLIAIFPISGFYSKDLILELASGSYSFSSTSGYVIGTVTAGLTAFYSIRLISLVFLGQPHGSVKSYNSVHEQPGIVQIPFVILTLLSIFFGYIARDFVSGLGSDGIMASTFNVANINNDSQNIIIQAEFQSQFLKLLPSLITVCGALLAVYVYNFNSGKRYIVSIKNTYIGKQTYSFLYRRFIVDVVYGYIIILGLNLAFIFSQILDRGSLEILGPTGLSQSINKVSDSLIRLDTGLLTTYGTYILLAIVSLIYVCIP